MARKPKSEEKPKGGGADRVVVDGKIVVPDPRLPKSDEKAPDSPAEKGKDPNKPKDVRVGAAYLTKALVASTEQTRLAKLRIKGRGDRDVRWLLDEYDKLSQSKKNNDE